MGRRGRKRQLDVETRYWRLLASGVGTVEACRRVGITRKTGYRWRAERGGVPPVRLNEDARSSRYLSLLERQRIATLRARGLGVREIARRLDRAPSTVPKSRDLNAYDADYLRLVEDRLNNRPRRTLGWKAPIDVFTPALTP